MLSKWGLGMPKYQTLINKGDAIAHRFPEKRAAWRTFKESEAVNEVRILAAMVEHLSEYQRQMTIAPTPESVALFSALHKN